MSIFTRKKRSKNIPHFSDEIMFPVSYIIPISRRERVREAKGNISDFIEKIKGNPAMLDADIHDFYDNVARRDGASIIGSIAAQTPEHLTQIESIRARQKAALVEAEEQLIQLEQLREEVDNKIRVLTDFYNAHNKSPIALNTCEED